MVSQLPCPFLYMTFRLLCANVYGLTFDNAFSTICIIFANRDKLLITLSNTNSVVEFVIKAASDLKVSRSSHLIEYMKVCEY